MSNSPHAISSLLGYMKLHDEKDPVLFKKFNEWVAVQRIPPSIAQISEPSCNTASSLLLLRLSRAFQQRLAPPKLNEAKPKSPMSSNNILQTAASSPSSLAASNTAAPTETEVKTESTNSAQASLSTSTANVYANAMGDATKNTTSTTTDKQYLPPSTLKSLMQRKVKVTKNVQIAVQFIGSDLLKVLQVLQFPPTIADVVDACLGMMTKDESIKEIYTLFQTNVGTKAEQIDASMAVFFGVFALQTLQTLRSQAITAFELAHDFDYIYAACYDNADFAKCVEALNPTVPPPAPGSIVPPPFAPDTEARNICWKIARLLALKQDNVSSKTDPEGKRRRRNHMITSTASILLAATLGQAKLALKNGQVAASNNTNNFNEPPVKKQKTADSLGTDFVDLAVIEVAVLGMLIARNSYNNPDFTRIASIEIRSQLSKVYGAMDKLKLVRDYEGGESLFKGIDANASISKSFPPTKTSFFLQQYRALIQGLVSEAQTNLQISAALTQNKSPPSPAHNEYGGNVRTAITNVFMLYPMVLGEPWGIHRDAPRITSQLLCKGGPRKPPMHLAASTAVVFTFKPRKYSQSPSAESKGSDVIMVDTLSRPPPPRPRAPALVQVGDLEPPVVNHSMELNEWTLSILSLSVVKPSDSLLMYLGETDQGLGDGSSCLHDVIVPVLNRGLLRVQGALRSANGSAMPLDSRLTIGRKDGQVYVSGQVDEGIQLCASVVGFYYHSLEAIIHDQMERLEFLGPFGSLLRSESFHRALLACCYACTLKGVGTTQKLRTNGSHKDTTVHLLMETIESSPYTFLKVAEALRRALIITNDPSKKKLGSPIVPGLPVVLQKHLQKLEAQLVDSIVWATTSPTSFKSEGSIATTIKTMRGLPGAWPPDVLEAALPEELADAEDVSSMLIDEKYKPAFCSSTEANFFSYVLRKLIKISFFRIQGVCAALNLSKERLLQTQILVAFRSLLRYHIELFYDRHIDQLILCTIYGVCRVLWIQPQVTFARLMDAYIAVRKDDQGERACRVILKHVKLVGNENDYRPEGKVVGNLIVFYNQLFVPRMQKHLTSSTSLKNAATEYRKLLSRPVDNATQQRPAEILADDVNNGISLNATQMSKGTAPAETWITTDDRTPCTKESVATAQQPNDEKTNTGNAAANTTQAKDAKAISSSTEASTTQQKQSLQSAVGVAVAQVGDCKEIAISEEKTIESIEVSLSGTQKRLFSSLGGAAT